MVKKIYKAYCAELPFVEVPHMPINATRAPTAADRQHAIGDVWVYKPTVDTGSSYVFCGIDSSGDAIWVLQSPGASDVDTLTGDGGGAISPTAGTIIIAGGTNITTAGTAGPGTITVNLDAAITLATSVTSPIYTAAAALDINAAAGSNVTIQLGDAAGANVLEIEDSASAAVATIDSNGIATFAGMDGVLGGVTPAAATATTVTANTSVTSPLYTASAADAVVQAGGANDVVLRLGDNAGATFLRVQDSDSADQFTIDSNGTLSTLNGLTVAGAFAQTAGTFNVGQDNAANAINIGGGNVARAIGIANSAAAHTLTIGNAACGAFTIDTGAGISIDGATASNFTVTGAAQDLTLRSVGGSVNVSATQAAADAISIQASDAAGGIDVDCGSGGFDLLATGGGFSIDGQAASNITVTAAGLDLSLQGVGGAVNVTSTQGENDAILIEASAANGGVQIRAGTGGILIGDEADTTGLTFGNIAPTANRNITIGSGTVVTASVTDDISIGDGGATTNADSIKHVDINNGGVTLGVVRTYIASGAVTSGTHTTEIATGNVAAGTATVSISTGTGTKTVTVGNADGNTTIGINGATAINTNVNAAFSANVGTSTGTVTLGNIANSGAMSLESSSTVDIDAAGAVSINSTGAALNIGNDADAFAINVGTGAAARTVTVGNTTGASALVLQAGTGEITMTGTVKQIDAELMGQTGVYVPAFTMGTAAVLGTNAGGAPSGATGAVNNLVLQGGNIMEEFVIGAGQTIIQPVMGANGLIINGDQTVAEGYEYNFPYLQYTIGTSAAFAFELGLYINDMDGAAPYVFGFRKTEANNAVMANYDTFASIGMVAASSVTNIVISDELNAGGNTITDTTDAWGGDGSYHVLRVLVDGTGNVTYTIDGVAPSVTHAFQFDNADVVIPYIRCEHSASPTDVAIRRMRIGFQA